MSPYMRITSWVQRYLVIFWLSNEPPGLADKGANGPFYKNCELGVEVLHFLLSNEPSMGDNKPSMVAISRWVFVLGYVLARY